MDIIELIECPIRRLTRIEKDLIYLKSGFKYKWVTTAPATLQHKKFTIVIPQGFLTDGSSGGPDFGNAWLFHDWCYATHKMGALDVTIYDADHLMSDILTFERAPVYSKTFSCISSCNPCHLFSSAWRISGQRGPQFLNEFY